MVVIQNLYNDLVSNVVSQTLARRIPAGASTYRRKLGNSLYWYAKTPAGKCVYLGKAGNEDVERLIMEEKRRKSLDAENRTAIRALRANGMPCPPNQALKVLRGFADAGLFELRAVLIGTLAYQTYIPMLGMENGRQSNSTMDMDIAQTPGISIVVGREASLDFEKVLMEFRNFVRKPHQPGSEPMSFWKDAETGFEVDLMTSLTGPWDRYTAELPALSIRAEKIKFMDFLIRDEVQAVILTDSGIAVNVPSPERFAVHKLIVGAERRNLMKARKDFRQAENLVRLFLDEMPDRIGNAFAEAWNRGRGWRKRLTRGLAAIDKKIADGLMYFVRNRPSDDGPRP